MVKKDLISYVANELDIGFDRARDCVDAVLNGIAEGVRKNQKVKIPKFGVFEVRNVPSRNIKLPGKDEVVKTTEHKTVKFKAGKNLKEKVN